MYLICRRLIHNVMKLLLNSSCKLLKMVLLFLSTNNQSNNKCNKKGNNMSVKISVVNLLTEASSTAQASVASNYNTLIASVNALPDDVSGDITTLQDQVTALTTQVASIQAIADQDAAELTTEKSNEAKLQAKLDAIKAALDS